MRYPSGMVLQPLEQWPRGETRQRRRSNFSAGLPATLQLLTTELHMLSRRGGRPAPSVLQIALRDEDFRITDGMPRASAVPSMPGVILHIEANVGPLSYPCDTFDRWHDNLRAIALGLEALRKVGRYGITPGHEQYAGWKALPQQPETPTFTAEQAEQFLREFVHGPATDGLNLGTIPQLVRRAKAAAHPDRNGGDQTDWDRVERAARVLEAAGAL